MGFFQALFPSRGIPKNHTSPVVRSELQRRDRSRLARDSLLILFGTVLYWLSIIPAATKNSQAFICCGQRA